MKIVEQDWTFEVAPEGETLLQTIERAGRVCYKSEDAQTAESARKRVKSWIDSGHHSVIEHGAISVRIITDRGVTHELVRHRLASYSMESTRYVSSVEKIKHIIDSENDVIFLYESGFSMREISERSDGKFTEWEIYKFLDNNDIERRPLGNHGTRNQNAFKNIDTCEKAYIFGMIGADGCMRKNLKQVTITQHEEYAWYIKLMLENILGGDVGVSKDKQCLALNFSGKEIVGDLYDKGIVPNKSFVWEDKDIDKYWNAVDEKYRTDFLRGYLDGDGSVRFFKQNNPGKTNSCNIGWVGKKYLMNKIGEWVNKNLDYTATILFVHGSKDLWRLTITKYDVGVRLCKLLYNNFKFPYGHPKKASRIMEVIGYDYSVAEFRDSKFKVILPVWFYDIKNYCFWTWFRSMIDCEESYTKLRYLGQSPQEARSVLPNSLKTEIVMTANPREWRHVFTLRTSPKAHPQIRALMIDMLVEFKRQFPVLFDDIGEGV